MFTTRAFFTARTMRSASSTFRASGFSHRIALPACAAAIAISQCEPLGVQISTMSILESSMTRRQSVCVFSQPSFAAAFLTAARLRPQIVFKRTFTGRLKNLGACLQAFECALPMKL